ncbi:hypothetical protein [Aquimarina algicola]|uniref:Uncharacterized protein n=1 Tax=Aquimarina algicola TaxID=2589995 RepID=A0A504J9V6_9FLAO|nr:hypothetical protein [Aquimarina algicola]TPN87424.1 hypothetical protein FHK87_07530 [Aquimarina algicola]
MKVKRVVRLSIFHALAASLFLSCSQTEEEKIAIKINTYVDTIVENVKHYPEEPVFDLAVFAPGAKYEVRVNDTPIVNRYGIDDNKYYLRFKKFSLNHAMGSKSIHKVTYRMIPLNKKSFENYDINDISIKSYNGLNDSKEIFLFEPLLTQKEDEESKEYIGNNFYNGSFTFQAKLPPYKRQIDWSESVNLQEQKNIEQEVLAIYKEIMHLYEEGDLDKLLELYKPVFQDEAQSVYATKEKKNRLGYKLDIKRLHPFFFKSQPKLDENYTLKFYANGKLVTLEKKSDSTKFYSESALSIRYEKDLDKLVDGMLVDVEHFNMYEKGIIPKIEQELYLFFYKPKGSKSLKLAANIYREEKLLNPVE